MCLTETYKNYLNKKGLYFSQLNDDSVDLSEFNNDEKAKSPDFNKHQQNLLKRWLAQ